MKAVALLAFLALAAGPALAPARAADGAGARSPIDQARLTALQAQRNSCADQLAEYSAQLDLADQARAQAQSEDAARSADLSARLATADAALLAARRGPY